MPEGEPARYTIKLMRPMAAVTEFGGSVRAKRVNLEALPADYDFGLGISAGAPDAERAGADGASGSGGAAAGGQQAGGNELPMQVRLKLALEVCKHFMESLNDDLYRSAATEGIFGVRMEATSPYGDLRGMTMGQLVFNAWRWYFEDRMQELDEEDDGALDRAYKRAHKESVGDLVRALLAGTLPGWYEGQLRRLEAEGRPSGYSHEILRRGCGAIPWDRVMHDRLAGRA
ncbi:hypothetical protein HYH03_009774 [Edaphochlamys debaryana]|uniref:Uncharacterized protein n=1 Tax=Edaphochlamys debaryana TaxID=47281 RepID=A0A835XY45_9CHLO|nr:hypothetical protein HYH03_009774 [Edaphochlamys debaryana]|eukprot:KAG2492045.1 hypothetical protein HYH03_009774 [Edaphochlamys debaryana]